MNIINSKEEEKKEDVKQPSRPSSPATYKNRPSSPTFTSNMNPSPSTHSQKNEKRPTSPKVEQPKNRPLSPAPHDEKRSFSPFKNH